MFEEFSKVWTPVLGSWQLKDEQLLPLVVAGTKLVFFRGPDGQPKALVDRCPHRGVALSAGRLVDGCVECPFHGWRLDGRGEVVRVPWNPDAKLAPLRGLALPVREVGSLIWLYTSADGAPGSEPSPPPVTLRDDVRVCGFAVDFDTHWTRLMENMLDWPHLPFVHANTIGNDLKRGPQARMDIRLEETETGWLSRIAIDDCLQPGSLELRWPNQMVLNIPVPDKTLTLINTCIPVSEGKCRLLVVTVRSFLKLGLMDPVFNWSNRRVVREDKAIVESSWPAAVPPPSDERSVRTDAPTLSFRKRYLAELASTPRSRAPKVRLEVLG